MNTSTQPTKQPVEIDLVRVLQNSLYPGASAKSVALVLDYCVAARLDPMQKPVHIVPMWDRDQGAMRDVIMPGIGLYRIQAARTGQHAGMSEPEFGPEIETSMMGVKVIYPAWCKVIAYRQMPNGHVAEFPAIEYWLENYAPKGGKDKSSAPNAMWARRPRGQLAKCATAQALRAAFPEFIGAQPTAEEMEGAEFSGNEKDITPAAQQHDEFMPKQKLAKPLPKPQERSHEVEDEASAASADNEPLAPSEPPAAAAPASGNATNGRSPGVAASIGLINVVRSKLERGSLNMIDVKSKFKIDSLDDISADLANQIIKWAGNPGE